MPTRGKLGGLTVLFGAVLASALLLQGLPFGIALADLDLSVFQKEGASEEEKSKDRYECHRVAVRKSGFDPGVKPPNDSQGGTRAEKAEMQAEQEVERRRQQVKYNQALSSCMERRGYRIAEH
jgi:hypothetical protein